MTRSPGDSPSEQQPDPADPMVGASGEDALEAPASQSPGDPADSGIATTGEDDTVEASG